MLKVVVYQTPRSVPTITSFSFSGFCKIAYVYYLWSDVFSIFHTLTVKSRHPSTISFAFSWKVMIAPSVLAVACACAPTKIKRAKIDNNKLFISLVVLLIGLTSDKVK